MRSRPSLSTIGVTLAIGGVSLTAVACAPAIREPVEAIARLERARADRPTSEPVLRSLGVAYYKAGRLGDARGSLEQAVSLDASDAVAALYLGMTAEALDDPSAARAAYAGSLRVGRASRVRGQLEARFALLARQELARQTKEALAHEVGVSDVDGSPTTVAVLPFSFSGADSSLRPLERGFAELLTTDLARSSKLTVVERIRLQALLDEIALHESGATSTADGSGVRAGRILRAGRLVRGSIVQQGDHLRADAVVVDVPTSVASGSASDAQALEQLFTLEKNVALRLFETLGVTLTTAERNAIEQRPTRSLAAFLSYSRGLELEDRGRFDDANTLFRDALRLDPAFGAARDKSREARSISAGSQVSPATIERGLRGTDEGAVASAAAAGLTESSADATGGVAHALADGLNPSAAGNASGARHTPTQPQKDPSSGTGADNPTRRSAHITITISQPQPGRP